MSEWQPIETAPEFEPILVTAPKANRGHDSCEVVVLVRHPEYEGPDGKLFSFWTNGGPNGGSDLWFDEEEYPTHWMPLPNPPVKPLNPISAKPSKALEE